LNKAEAQDDHMNSWPILALLGSLIILVLFVADWEMHEHLYDVSKMRPPPHSALYADPDLKLLTERSP
jgi:hypothetical protein